MENLREEIETLCTNAKLASVRLALCSTEEKNTVLLRMAQMLEESTEEILEANRVDLENAEG